VCLALSLCSMTVGAQQLAFPGAQGWARFMTCDVLLPFLDFTDY